MPARTAEQRRWRTILRGVGRHEARHLQLLTNDGQRSQAGIAHTQRIVRAVEGGALRRVKRDGARGHDESKRKRDHELDQRMAAHVMRMRHHLTNANATHERPTGASTPPHGSGLSITSSAACGALRGAVQVTRAADTPPMPITDASPPGSSVAARERHALSAASFADGADTASATESAIHAACS